MGLDQAILIGPKGGQPEGALMQFRKHDRLHGFMERLSYQKGIVDPFEQVEVDWSAIEQRIHDELKAQLDAEIIMNPDEETMEDVRKSNKPKETMVFQPTFDISEYYKGRLRSDVLVPLDEEDFGYLIEAFGAFMQAESDAERDEILPPCKGLFFGESSDDAWGRTAFTLHAIFNQFGFDEYDYYYISNW